MAPTTKQSAHHEVELKLVFPASHRAALLKHPLLKGKSQTKKLINQYVDTQDSQLHHQRIAVRVRQQGNTWLQTVKCAAQREGGLTSRPEWETPFNGNFDFSVVGDTTTRKLLERLHQEGQLRPVFETNFVRRTWAIQGPSGATVLVMLDEGEIRSGKNKIALRELELESTGGPSSDLFDIAWALSDKVALRPESLSKAERGYRLGSNEPTLPAPALPSPLRSGMGAPAAPSTVLQACLAHYQANEAGAMSTDSSLPRFEYQHQMRIALRRMNAALHLFANYIPADTAAQIQTISRALQKQLARPRALHIAQGATAAALEHHSGAPQAIRPLQTKLQTRQAVQLAQFDAWLHNFEYARSLLKLTEILHQLPNLGSKRNVCAAKPLLKHLQRRIKSQQEKLTRRARGILKQLDAKKLPSANTALQLHTLRLKIKRLRYQLAFCAPILKQHEKLTHHLARLQQQLGIMTDLHSMGPLLLETCGARQNELQAVHWIGTTLQPHYQAAYRAVIVGLGQLAKAPAVRFAEK